MRAPALFFALALALPGTALAQGDDCCLVADSLPSGGGTDALAVASRPGELGRTVAVHGFPGNSFALLAGLDSHEPAVVLGMGTIEGAGRAQLAFQVPSEFERAVTGLTLFLVSEHRDACGLGKRVDAIQMGPGFGDLIYLPARSGSPVPAAAPDLARPARFEIRPSRAGLLVAPEHREGPPRWEGYGEPTSWSSPREGRPVIRPGRAGLLVAPEHREDSPRGEGRAEPEYLLAGAALVRAGDRGTLVVPLREPRRPSAGGAPVEPGLGLRVRIAPEGLVFRGRFPEEPRRTDRVGPHPWRERPEREFAGRDEGREDRSDRIGPHPWRKRPERLDAGEGEREREGRRALELIDVLPLQFRPERDRDRTGDREAFLVRSPGTEDRELGERRLRQLDVGWEVRVEGRRILVDPAGRRVERAPFAESPRRDDTHLYPEGRAPDGVGLDPERRDRGGWIALYPGERKREGDPTTWTPRRGGLPTGSGDPGSAGYRMIGMGNPGYGEWILRFPGARRPDGVSIPGVPRRDDTHLYPPGRAPDADGAPAGEIRDWAILFPRRDDTHLYPEGRAPDGSPEPDLGYPGPDPTLRARAWVVLCPGEQSPRPADWDPVALGYRMEVPESERFPRRDDTHLYPEGRAPDGAESPQAVRSWVLYCPGGEGAGGHEVEPRRDAADRVSFCPAGLPLEVHVVDPVVPGSAHASRPGTRWVLACPEGCASWEHLLSTGPGPRSPRVLTCPEGRPIPKEE